MKREIVYLERFNLPISQSLFYIGGYLQGVIVAAGKGRRLGSFTQTRSKGMQPILGRPLVERAMAGLHRQGVDEFVVVVNPRDTQLREHLASGLAFAADVRLACQEEPLGMGHAVQQAASFIQGDFVLAACDNLLPDADLARFFRVWAAEQPLNGLLALLAIQPEQASRTGVVARAGPWIQRIVEKPTPGTAPSSVASIPLYAFSARILPHLEDLPRSSRGEYELQDGIQRLIDVDGRVRGELVSERVTVTTAADLWAINQRFLRADAQQKRIVTAEVGPGTVFIPPVYVETAVTIGQDCVVGPNVYIEAGSRVGDAVIMEDTVLLSGAIVDSNRHVKERIMGA